MNAAEVEAEEKKVSASSPIVTEKPDYAGEALRRLNDIDADFANAIRVWQGADQELAHSEADKLLLRLLTEFGMHQTVKAFNEIDKWYA